MVINGVNFPEADIAAFCARHHVRRLSVFGSILREATGEDGDGFRPSSDVDVLVEFEEGQTPSLVTFAGMEREFCELTRRNVQLSTPLMLSRYFRESVLKEVRMLHAA